VRIKSHLWVSALLRRARAEAAFATVLNKGEESAGAIFVAVSDMQGRASLLGPAPQSFFGDDQEGGRQFEWLMQNEAETDVHSRLLKEKSFDSDVWIIEIEDRDMRSFVDDIVSSS